MKFEFINDNLIHQDVNYTFTIGLTGLIKHTAHIEQDVRFEEQGDEYILTVVKSTEVAKSEVRVKIEDMGGDKINIKVSLIQLYFKRGVLELVGRRIVINRFRGEIRKLLKKAARKLRDGSLDPILKKCDEELEKANQE